MQTLINAVARVAEDDVDDVPEGFELMPAFGPFHELVGATWYRKSERGPVVGMRVREQHCNLGQMMHGGMVCMLADTAIKWASKYSREPALKVLTTSLTVNFLGNAQPGDWVEAHVEVLRTGKRVVFSDCSIWANGQRIAQASAQFQVMGQMEASGGCRALGLRGVGLAGRFVPPRQEQQLLNVRGALQALRACGRNTHQHFGAAGHQR
ncbi:PaaI family thioesterase [Paraburkholderia sp. BL10I2N1]|uniref:PaaI family thioesterase n=1 Tax=Paraburkholderia sp. BL10I2N1 TaxID=1938796 RepID=UPI00105DAC70|nr:PaaI family thioesterase [Paraburkholderia sp. BL10I2N1]TDN59192.1 uncharacterized protein (TIGR00369 family) [Paraburkholderia sp. BL10I2N1]